MMFNMRWEVLAVAAFAGAMAGAIVGAASCSANNPQQGKAHQDDAAEAEAALRIEWREPFEVARGNAERGPWRMNRSEWDFVDDATVAINAQGFAAVAWADHTKQDILIQLYDPRGRTVHDEPVNVTRSGSIFSWLPRVALTDADDPAEISVYVLWQEIIFSGGSHGGEILFARSDNGGATFSQPINLSNTTAGAGKGRLTSQSWHNGSYDFVRLNSGRIVVAWTEYEGNLWVSHSTDDGRRFSEPWHVAGGDPELPARGPALAAGPDGVIHLAWTVGEYVGADIHYARSADGGESFTEPSFVAETSAHADAPKLAVDSRGTVHAVYAESEDDGGMMGRYRLRYARMANNEERFGAVRDLVTPRQAGVQSVHFPMLRIDGNDRLIVTFERYPNWRGRPVGLGVMLSGDGGETFTTPSVVPGSDDRELGFNGSQQGLLASKLAVNRAGEIAVGNSSYRNGRASHVTVYRGRVVHE
jgi:hypothetical protein